MLHKLPKPFVDVITAQKELDDARSELRASDDGVVLRFSPHKMSVIADKKSNLAAKALLAELIIKATLD